ncbi:ABC transporter substrate-binding protein [Kineosporia corallincola]|uniref:ABC transporter substrate-binding protein n=1 Tax=Kineosporia corallincola TaxID=2835133 RepID=UPI0027E0B826|nr:ABC transporter substrate-binding protein [Kineosporia corallincola]
MLSVLSIGLAACGGGGDPLRSAEPSPATGGTTITVGSANFPESQLLGEMYAQVLENAGLHVERRFGIGSREIYVPALRDGSIDVLPEYNGALLAYLAGNEPVDAGSAEAVAAGLDDELPSGLELLDPAPAEAKDALVVTRRTADRYALTSLADLPPVAGDLVVGAGPEYRERQQGLVGLRSEYGLNFKNFQALDAGGPLTVQALRTGRVQLGGLLSTDPVIAQEDFVVLDDPRRLFGVQNVIPLARKGVLPPEAVTALNAFSENLTTDKLSAALGRFTLDQEDAATIARDYLDE